MSLVQNLLSLGVLVGYRVPQGFQPRGRDPASMQPKSLKQRTSVTRQRLAEVGWGVCHIVLLVSVESRQSDVCTDVV